jgi:predicted O-methyltransferase YrrM
MMDDGGPPDRLLPFLSEAELEHWQQMPGFLLPSAAQRLYQAAAEAPVHGQIVELGSFAGKSLVCLARGVASGLSSAAGNIVAVDVAFHEAWPASMAFFGLEGIVTPMEMSTLEAGDLWSDPIAMLYIDADHGPAHARADFVVWEPFVVAGGVIALDDTVGFYPGCTLQVQMALADGRYEVIDDVGGITFLRKAAPLFEHIGFAPYVRDAAFAVVAAASAWSGAMDVGLCLPMPMRFTLPSEAIEDRLRRALASLDRLRSRLAAELEDEVLPTVDYIEAVVLLQLGEHEGSLRLLERLVDGKGRMFFHYDLEIAPLARLRRAQVLDVEGHRTEALRAYEEISRDGGIEAVTAGAAAGQAVAFELPAPVAGRLLREYVLDSPLAHCRRGSARQA